MDWSVLKLKAEHKFIRPEIIYTGFIPVSFTRVP